MRSGGTAVERFHGVKSYVAIHSVMRELRPFVFRG
jgi:hypothetical protein